MSSSTHSWRACEACFELKIKCDRKLPSCIQCSRRTRGKRPCIYRQTQLDLVLRDENKKITGLHNKTGKLRTGRPGPFLSSKTNPSCASKSPYSTAPQKLSINGLLLNDSASAVGKKILLTNFPHGIYHQYLPAIYFSSITDLGLDSSIEAVGLMCLAAGRSEKRLMLEAREKHLLALKTTSHLVSHTTVVASPYPIVASVMLLALFAVMSPDNLNPLDIWTKHVDGALSILAIQDLTHGYLSPAPSAQNLVQHIMNSLHLSCFQQRRRVPQAAIRIYDCLPDNGRIQAYIHAVINGIADLHMEMHKTQNIPLQVACTLDQELASIMLQLAESQPFTTVPSPNNQQNGPRCHKYSSHRAAQIWNFVRILRLSLNSLIRNYLTNTEKAKTEPSSAGVWFPLDAQSLERYILSDIAFLTYEVCASVPSFLRPELFNDGDDRLDITHWAHSLIWPISMVQALPNLPQELSIYIDNALPILWQAARFPHTTMPGKSCLITSPPETWTHIFFWC